MVPIKRAFANASAVSVDGNDKLCGGIPKLQLPPCHSKEPKKSLSLKLKLLIVILSGLFGIILCVSFLFLFLYRRKKEESTPKDNCGTSMELSYWGLHKATDGFSSTNVIGIGSFGSVYKGVLDGGNLIAVKVFNLIRRGALKSFIAECEASRNIRHRNLVKVLTACSGVDHEGNDFKALVYEFMPNGSLENWLHPQACEANLEPRILNILQRLSIAIDVANALSYLHHESETPIVHCDLKPSNILLDDTKTAHVSDFGLAKLFLHDDDDHIVNLSSSIGVRGTAGYAPPEYGMGNEISTYGDVYSYGILLLEMFTGKRPTDGMFNECFNLHQYVEEASSERVEEIIDHVLLKELEEFDRSNTTNAYSITAKEDKDRVMESVSSILSIGVSCSDESARKRMSINVAAAQLVSIRDKLLRTKMQNQRINL